MVSQLKFKYINVFTPSCCSFNKHNSNIYIGAHLGSNNIAYKDEVRVHDDFEQYYNIVSKSVVY